MNDITLPRWITISEASQYSGFSSDIIYDALWKDHLVTNLVFRTRVGSPERLIDRQSLDEWIGRHVPVPCSRILTKEFLKQIPDGCYVVSNNDQFAVSIESDTCRDHLWQSAVEHGADFIRCYVTTNTAEFEILKDSSSRWGDENLREEVLAVKASIPILDDEISLAKKVS
jgi:hypothetical protein